jgi:hypothetical protein
MLAGEGHLVKADKRRPSEKVGMRRWPTGEDLMVVLCEGPMEKASH